MRRPVCLAFCAGASIFAAAAAFAGEGDETQSLGNIEVSATPLAEPVKTVPQSITIITRDELQSLHATDLRSAIQLAAGVDMVPGGDGGPASSVPEFQGLREFDAFLLLVDGVPWGGAFNPDLPTIDLNDVDRIEVIRGAAPVKYGATSFVGVINIIHRPAGAPGGNASVSFGSYGSASAAVALALTSEGPVRQSLAADMTRQDMSDPRAGYNRSHVLYRSAVETDNAEFRLDLDGLILRQRPTSPRPLPDGAPGLTPLVPPDTNNNPSDARIDEDRFGLTVAEDVHLGFGDWSTTLSPAFTHNHNVRGFLRADQLTDNGLPNADGFDQTQDRTDMYFDSHLTLPLADTLRMVTGLSYIYGWGQQSSANFEYFVHLDGSNPPPSTASPVDERTHLQDKRDFLGAYVQTDWNPAPRWDVTAGVEFNRDVQTTDATFFSSDPAVAPSRDGDHRNDTRASGMLGASHTAWQDGADHLVVYGDYRNTFKPAAVDFGPEAEPDLLQPETAQAYEVGAKGALLQGRLSWDASAFLTNMDNTVIAVDVNGLPGLANGGQQRFKGVELGTDWRLTGDWRWQVAGSYHDATYRNFVNDTPGGLVQDAGNRLELSPRVLLSTGVFYLPEQGFNANAVLRYTGSRYFDPENAVKADAFTAVDAGVGYRFGKWNLNLQGRNLTDRRDPVANSELGESQAYVMPGRFVELSLSFDM